MKKNIVILLLLSVVSSLCAQIHTMLNDRYRLSYDSGTHELEVMELSSQVSRIFSPTFQVVYRSAKPNLSLAEISEDFNYKTVAYNGDTDLFSANAGSFTLCVPESVVIQKDTLVISYQTSDKYIFKAKIFLPQGNEEPVVISDLQNLVAGYFSVGYYGAPEQNIDGVKELFQPLPFIGKRAPQKSYLTPAFLATLPGTFLTVGNITYGVYADPVEFPFAPLPCTLARSPFGVAIRNQYGIGKELKPMVWAPIIGNSDSYMSVPNEKKYFRIRLYVSGETLTFAYEDIACRVFGFGDYRNNDLGSLNTTMDRMIDYAMSTEWGVWKADMKGSSYDTDVEGAVKNTSALSAYAMAFVVDNENIFNERAMPVLEFLLSRENTMFAYSETGGAGGQTATNSLGKPCMNVSEMLSFYSITGNKMDALYELALQNKRGSLLSSEVALKENFSFFRATGESLYRTNLIEGTNKYIEEEITNKPTDFAYVNHSKSSFWSQIAPKFVELYEIYKTTGDIDYLYAAHQAARSYAYFLWMAPRFELSDSVLCNVGNKAPNYRSGTPIFIPEEKAPAWRLSEMGLQCECGGTSTSKHRGIFTANYAPYLLRIGSLVQDSFLLNIGKAGVIGRYSNFPGYHINTDRTTVYEKENFPLRPLSQLTTTTSMHYSHIWTQINLLLDYMVSDVAARTHGKIDFPGYYVQNIVHMQSQVYMQGGEFYGEKGLVLYMPQKFLVVDNKQLNYVTAYGNNKLYIIFTNQSNNDVYSSIVINPNYISIPDNVYKCWEENELIAGGTVKDNLLSVHVGPGGVTAIAVENVIIKPKFQQKILQNTYRNKWSQYYVGNIEVGNSKAVLLNPSDSLTRLFVFSTAPSGELDKFQIDYSIDGQEWHTEIDDAYPFEFTIKIDDANSIDYKITIAGRTSEVYRMERLKPTAVLEGWNSIKRSQGADMYLFFNGESPFDITYTENGNLQSITDIPNASHVFHVAPQYDSRYTLCSVVDAYGTKGTVTGNSKVVVVDGYEALQKYPVVQDAQTFNSQPANNFGSAEQIELKGIPSNRKDLYFTFELPEIELADKERLKLGLWLNSKKRLDEPGSKVMLVLDKFDTDWVETELTWQSRPADAIMQSIDTIAITNDTPVDGFIYFDITPLAEDGGGNLNCKVSFLDGEEAASLYIATKEDVEQEKHPHIALMTEAERTEIYPVQKGDNDVVLTPTIVSALLNIHSSGSYDEIIIYNSNGQTIRRMPYASVLDLSFLARGSYFLMLIKDGMQQVVQQIVKK